MFQILSGRLQTVRPKNALLGAIALALLRTPFAEASLGVAAVGGMIRDPSGNSVPGAKVVLTELSKHLVHTSETDRGGSFLFALVLAGDYKVYVEKEGFRSYQVDQLTVAVGETATLPITLTLGDVRTVLTISALSNTELDTESNTLGVVIDSERVHNLPLNGRNFLELALLAGGAAEISPANTLSSGNVGPPARQITLPGTLPQSTGYSLNGFNLSGSRDGELVAGLSLAVIDQFKVEQSFLMPDQGPGAASINVVTRTGSNEFHGQAIEFLRNRRLDARSFFAAAPEDLKRNQFGVALGGPIWPNRMWFYGTYEGTRELTAFNAAGYSPTQNMFNGAMADTGRLVYDPFTYNASSGTRQPFPGNSIPQARINPVSRGLLRYYQPGSTLASRPSNIFGNPRNTLNDDQGSIRIDLAPKPRHQLALQYFGQSTPVDRPGLFPLSGALYANSFSLAGLEHTWTLSSRTVNSFRAGFLRSVAVGGNEAQSSLLSSIGIANTFGDRGISLINLQGYSSFGNSTGDVGNWDNTWQANDEMNYLRGTHQFALGGGFWYRRSWQQNSNRSALGVLSFQPTFTAQLARNVQGQLTPVAGTGDSFGDFLLGPPVTGTITGLPVVEYRSKQFTLFVQDTWKIKENLTLNYGVSWFAETAPDPQGSARSSIHGFGVDTGLLVFSSLGQLNPKIMKTDRNNLAPRLGVAWKPRRLSNTVIRGGAGLYYVPFPLVLELYPLALGSPSTAGVGFTNPQTTPLPAYQLGQNIFPPAPANAVTSTYAANLPPGTQVTALDPAFRTGYISQWNAAIQHSLTERDSIEIAYLGSSGHRMPVLTDLSQCRLSGNLFCAAAAKPWPRYGVVYWATSAGNTSSEQLIARYARRTTRGLNLHFEYTLGKTLSDAWESSLLPRAQIADCRACDKGPATFDTRNRGVASLVWESPFGHGRLASGWSLSAITTFTTGQPVLLTGPNQTNTLFLNHLPDRVCDGRSGQLSGNIRNNGFIWFDARCFPVPAPGFFGNSGSTVIYGPGLNNWDVGIGKATRLTESVATQIRVELFNTWNHPQFQQPSGNAGDGSNFGRISAARAPRLIQVALKLIW
ncbi:MAG: carboxypeptidase regulatory-like domain-containing protein [Bryobacteraceae bacterium]